MNNMKVFGFIFIAVHWLNCVAAEVTTSNDVPVVDLSSILDYQTYPCNCPLIYRPVCGSDGNTYSNDCVLNCASVDNIKNGRPPIYILRQGECPQENCICPAVYQPVCGSDGNTYSNECVLVCESNRRKKLGLPGINVVGDGPCTTTACACSNIIIPVCGTNGRTYRNICFLQCASRISQGQGRPPFFFQYYGACAIENCLCTLEIDPVCASDGKTYNNRCLLRCENDRRNALGLDQLTIVKEGPCTVCNCSNTYDPVCASDQKTYLNQCKLDCENVARKQAGLPPLTVLYKGICGCNCTKEYNPVCGTDDRTYDNPCLLQCESNRRVLNGQSPIFMRYAGQCVCNCRNCTTFFQPVCGSDNRTYWNICWLECQSSCNVQQGRPPIRLVKYGYC